MDPLSPHHGWQMVDGAARLQVQKITEYRNIKKSTNRNSPAEALDRG